MYALALAFAYNALAVQLEFDPYCNAKPASDGVATTVEHIFTGKSRSIRAKRRLPYRSGYDALRFARLAL